MKGYERFLNWLGWIGLLFLVPVGLTVFGVPGPLSFLHSHLGKFGSATFLLIVFYALILLRFLFGHSEIYSPVFIGLIVSFFLVAITVEIGFMGWYRNLLGKVPYVSNHPLIFLVGVAVAIVGLWLGRLKRLHLIAQLLLLLVIPVALIVVANIYGVAVLPTAAKAS